MSDDNYTQTKVSPRRSYVDANSVFKSIKAVLVVLTGTEKDKQYVLTKAETIIGRGNDVDIYIDDTSVSRQHATILFRDLEFRIKDLESSNGTFLNGSEVTEYALRNGDKIGIGDTLFRLNISQL